MTWQCSCPSLKKIFQKLTTREVWSLLGLNHERDVLLSKRDAREVVEAVVNMKERESHVLSCALAGMVRAQQGSRRGADKRRLLDLSRCPVKG